MGITRRMLFLLGLLASALHPAPTALAGGHGGWKAGLAKVVITPERPMWMAGYGNRTAPSEGTLHDIWAKALALEDAEETRGLLITLDLCGIDRDFSMGVRREIAHRHEISLDRIVLACSHTHTSPVVGSNLITMYPLDDEQRKRVESYTELLGETIVGLAGEAIEDLSEVHLSWGRGEAGFAVNRRENVQDRAEELREAMALKGPVDHDVPVLVLRAGDEVRGVVFGYACHCTTLSINHFSGDYAGFAMMELEREYPEATALFVAGCGADQNPLPRRSVELAEKYGKKLAGAVKRTVKGHLRPILGGLQSAYGETDLAFAPVPDRSHWEREAESETFAVANRARAFLGRLDRGETLPGSYPYPVQVWRLGGLTWIFLGGEVVVDYALRIKRNLGPDTFVSAYCNDVMAYIPSLRVLEEGGYEGETAMIYYGQPGPWAEDVEERVIAEVNRLVRKVGGGPGS
ncbi:neutral/alkaline non-lysosomal ceramidase N-terminal domain-containing protein [Tautonia plasticadhaerens]|uniref:Neutral/alkaline non-lysosomal ceramidase n=1 Tax=Tautonia plasticadhaerens TaxID=2527974 RepID=A0A518GYT6_9BACT|nr:neutral/alkaline non-lysosomal ceramidase N-terminal domain-containing protein [Tautonia plasticadhaerens]QDV33759.1 Neutral/alkaline non-lysosomal ceramidase [Tautonia plasticadhaerens]